MKLKQGLTPFVIASAVAILALGTGNTVVHGEAGGPPEIILHPVNPHFGQAPTAGSTSQMTPRIGFHGGPVMGTPTIYMIWYGNWNSTNGTDTPAGQSLLTGFLQNLGGSPYYQTNGSYTGVSGVINVGPSYSDNYSHGTVLTDAAIQAIVSSAIGTGTGPLGAADKNGIYLVLTSSDVTESSGFCTKYCGWHTHGTIAGLDVKYAFVGNANQCLNACAIQTTSPNGNAGVDGMISVVAHEVEETNTDPDLNAWFNAKGAEDADMCAWTFGHSQTQLPSGAWFNMTMSGVNYMVQRELDVNSKCYVNYATRAQ